MTDSYVCAKLGEALGLIILFNAEESTVLNSSLCTAKTFLLNFNKQRKVFKLFIIKHNVHKVWKERFRLTGFCWT